MFIVPSLRLLENDESLEYRSNTYIISTVEPNQPQNLGIQLSPALKDKFKNVSSMASLASFPCNIRVYGQNPDEFLLLFVRKDRIILIFNVLIQVLLFFFPFLLQFMLNVINDLIFQNAFNLATFFASNYWNAIILAWTAYILRGLYNIFFKWFYDINILTTNRFIDLDLINLFHHRLEETSILNIEDAKDTQKGIIQSIFNMGDLEVFTASGQTAFNLPNVPLSHKIRDFIMDVVVEERKKVNDARK